MPNASAARFLPSFTMLLFATALLPVSAIAPAQDVSPPAAVSAPNINITPRRVILSPRKRGEAVFVFNQGTSPITVDVALVDNVMLPTGEIVPVAEATKRGGIAAALAAKLTSARAGMIVSPSRLMLAAGKGRTVRIQAPLAAAGSPTEARTHLTITTVPPASSGLTAEQASETARRGELSFNVQTIFGLSIPVIVRNGSPVAQVSFGTIELVQEAAPPPARGTTPVLVVPVNRAGGKSVYGNLEVRAGKGKAFEVIGLARGLGVYTELDQRVVRLALARAPRAGETLTVSYYDDEGSTSNGKLASGEITVK